VVDTTRSKTLTNKMIDDMDEVAAE
jgi:hypothetical protein